jgi:hypothetical protein
VFISSAGYNAWRDTKKPTTILSDLCQTSKMSLPVYTENFHSVKVADQNFPCDPSCIEFVTTTKTSTLMLHRKVHHESPEEYIQQNTALGALHAWGRKINPVIEQKKIFSLFLSYEILNRNRRWLLNILNLDRFLIHYFLKLNKEK